MFGDLTPRVALTPNPRPGLPDVLRCPYIDWCQYPLNEVMVVPKNMTASGFSKLRNFLLGREDRDPRRDTDNQDLFRLTAGRGYSRGARARGRGNRARASGEGWLLILAAGGQYVSLEQAPLAPLRLRISLARAMRSC